MANIHALLDDLNPINDRIDGLGTGFQGTIKIADTKTENGIYIPTEAGVYPNAGGLEYDPTQGLTYFIRTDGVWTKNVTPINFTPTGVVEEGNTQAVSGGEVWEKTVTNESNRALPIGDEFLKIDRPDLDIDKKILIVDDDLNISVELNDSFNSLYREEEYDRPDLGLVFIDEKGNVVYESQKNSANIDDSKVVEIAEKLSLKYTEFGTQEGYVVQPAIPFFEYIKQWDLLMDSKINNPDFPNYITKTQISESSNYAMPIWRYDFKPPSPKGKVIISCCNHGWEKNPSYAIKNFFDKLVNEWSEHDMMQWLRWNVHFIVIPVLSPEGYSPNPFNTDEPDNRGSRRVLETIPFDATWTKIGDRITITYNVNDFPNTNGRLDGGTYFSGDGVEKKVYISILESSSEDSLPNTGLLIDKVNAGNSIDVLFSGGASTSGTCKICVSVDPNRGYQMNFPKWEDYISTGTVNGTPLSAQDNKGTKPYSLNETIVMRDLIETENDIDLLLDFHSGYIRQYTYSHNSNQDITPLILTNKLTSDFNSDEYKILSGDLPTLTNYAGQIKNINALTPEWNFWSSLSEQRATQEFRWYSNLINICSKFYITQKNK